MIPMLKIEYCILHHSAEKTSRFTDEQHYLSVKNTTIARYGSKFELVYHYFISPGGIIYNGQPEGQVCPHCGVDIGEGPVNNWNALGICCAGNFETEVMPTIQYKTLVKLMKDINVKYQIPKCSIYRHSNVANTACPGKHFPFDSILDEVYKIQSNFPDVSSYDWFYPAVNFCSENGFMNGDEYGFRPDDPITRAEAAAVVYNILHKSK